MKVNKAVIDTNVLISAVLSPKGSPSRVVSLFVEHGRVVFSNETFQEFHSRLWLPKFDAYISREIRQSILRDFSNIADWVESEQTLMRCRDSDDDKFLSLAVSAKVDMLISGDSDLTILKNIEGIPIYTPAECLNAIDSR